MNADFFGGHYTQDEIERIMNINARPTSLMKPFRALYRKTATEHAPTWREKREFVHFLIHKSNISPQSKVYLQECEHWIPKYQLRGFKYGLTTSALTFMFFPVIR